MIDLPFSALPPSLQEPVRNQWQRVCAAQDSLDWLAAALAAAPDLPGQLVRVLAGSQFVGQWWERQPEWLREAVTSGHLGLAYADGEHEAQLQALLPTDADEATLMRLLRQYRQQQMIRMIFRDLNRLATMQDTARDVSLLADAVVDVTLQRLYEQQCKTSGVPRSESGEQQYLVVLGMGKLGGFELNLSSDIDLIFAFPESGETTGVARSVDNQTFFLRLCQRLIRIIDTINGDGFVFRVDMRLRPYGQSGALVLNFDAMEQYYQHQGRDWERYAMIKARVMAGDKQAGRHLMEMLRPFTYRRYLDYSAFESLREMKSMITREVARRGKQLDVKLGAGGIREVEFIAQAFQLIRGGRETGLQERNLLAVLPRLEAVGCLPAGAVAELAEAYVFLRNVEHAIQAQEDRQTQALPGDVESRARLAFVMDCVDWPSFEVKLEGYRQCVSRHFAELIEPEEDKAKDAGVKGLSNAWWVDGWDEAVLTEFLTSQGFDVPDEAARRLVALRDGAAVGVMQAIGRERLTQLMPLLLKAVADSATPTETLNRILPLVEAVLRRTAYLVLLFENPQALQQLVVLCQASPWIAEQLARHPVLLDELLNIGTLYQPPQKDELRADLRQQMLRLEWDDLEGHMEGLRYFRLAHGLRVAAAEVTGRLPLMKVSDYLTWIAEVVLEHVFQVAWQQLSAKHGRPTRADGQPCDPDFIIVGYGKSGGIEMGHGSDLDLVFIHDAGSGATEGEKSLDNNVFFARLGQRLIHILTAHTPMGQLYEVDMRLRPSGNSGLLVSSLKAFVEYQENQAWTWEHQALVRARVLAGCPELAVKFETVRHGILSKARDVAKLRQDVLDMRQKMLDQFIPAGSEATQFHLKHGRGGIVDIEFMVQYAVLAWAATYPALTRYTDNIRILETMAECGLISSDRALALKEAYIAYRSQTHRQALQRQSSVVAAGLFVPERETVIRAWQEMFGLSPV